MVQFYVVFLSNNKFISLLFTNVNNNRKTPLIKNLSLLSVTAIIKHKKEPTPNRKIFAEINTFFNTFLKFIYLFLYILKLFLEVYILYNYVH